MQCMMLISKIMQFLGSLAQHQNASCETIKMIKNAQMSLDDLSSCYKSILNVNLICAPLQNIAKFPWEVACLILEIYKSKPQYFQLPTTNPSSQVNTICTWIYKRSRAASEKRSAMTHRSHPEVWEYVKDATGSQEFYICSQQNILTLAISLWGTAKSSEEAKRPTPADYVRLVGVMLKSDFRDEFNVLLDNRKDREVLDDPALKKKEIYKQLAERFSDCKLIILHPKKWQAAVDKGNVEDIDPNDSSRVQIQRSGEDIKAMYDIISKNYKE